jgi:peptide/nickel transport system substrate-binding protein
MDDSLWPSTDLNQLYLFQDAPWPDWLEYTVYQSLVTPNVTAEYQQNNLEYVPFLANNWTISSDQASYTFNLRQNVHFSNGDPFNAYQIWMEEYGFYYLSANSSSWDQVPIFNMSNVSFGPATIALINQSGLINPSQQALSIMMNSTWPIYVTGPYQIVFHLANPYTGFLGTLLAYNGLMLDTQFVLDHGGFGNATSVNGYFNLNDIPGTGPYVVSKVVEDNYVVFTQDPNYWDSNITPANLAAQPFLDPGHAKTVVINYKPDDVSRFTDLNTGAAQIATITSQDWNLVSTNPAKFAFFKAPAWADLITAVSINTQLYPTNITDVRLAIVHAINYSDIIQNVFHGDASPYVGPTYPGYADFYDLGNFSQYSYNVTLAQQYLAEANVSNIPSLNFPIVAGCYFCSNLAQIVQSDLGQIGINVVIQVEAFSQYAAPYVSYAGEAANPASIGSLGLLGGTDWAPATLSPGQSWFTFVSNQSLAGNWAIYNNPVVQSCVNAFASSANVSYIQSLCKPAQTQIYNDAPYAWLAVNQLWDADGSAVWINGTINSFLMDPLYSAGSTLPIFNTVTFK